MLSCILPGLCSPRGLPSREKPPSTALVLAFCSLLWFPAKPVADEEDPGYVERTLQGRVVYLGDAMRRLHAVKIVPEAQERMLVLESKSNQIHPILEDIRGRAFRRDERLRQMQVELLVRQHHGSPLIQVVKIFELQKEAKLEVDYWCEICSIAMFELKPCDCCQEDIILRTRPVDADGNTAR